jgi:hypothetical protein
VINFQKQNAMSKEAATGIAAFAPDKKRDGTDSKLPESDAEKEAAHTLKFIMATCLEEHTADDGERVVCELKWRKSVI